MACVRTAVIAGAGIGGLTLARALLDRAVQVTVVEQAPQLSEVGAGITIWRNGLNGLSGLGLDGPLQEHGYPMRAGGIGLSDGRMLTAVDLERLPTSIPRPLLLTFHRHGLQRLLYDALPAGSVRFGARVDGYRLSRDRVCARLSDGDELATELLVGADGVTSRVRAQLLGEAPARYAGYTCFRGVVAAEVPSPGEFWGHGTRFGMTPLCGGRAYWFAVVNAPARSAVADPKAFLREKFSGYAWGIPALIQETAPEAILHNDIVDRPPVKGWSGQQVTLLGDAAHPTTPNLGQGAAMAIESAIVLARALASDTDLPRALATYERARRPRTTHVTNTSLRIGAAAHLEPSVLRGARNMLLRSVPQAMQRRALRKLVDYDPITAPLR